jgi:hypothetical protein
MTRFQLADSEAVVREVLGRPADRRIVDAMYAANRLNLFVFIPAYGLFLLMAGSLVVGSLDDELTAVILGATFAGLVGDVIETSTQLQMTSDLANVSSLIDRLRAGATMNCFGLGAAAMACAYACMRERPRRYGLAFGAVMQVVSTLAAFYDPARFGAGLPGSIGGFWVGLTIFAVQESLRGLHVWPTRGVFAARGLVRRTVGVLAVVVVGASVASAQELEARAFSPAPIGTKIFVGGVG